MCTLQVFMHLLILFMELSRIIYTGRVCVCSCALFGVLEAASIPTAVRLGYAGI